MKIKVINFCGLILYLFLNVINLTAQAKINSTDIRISKNAPSVYLTYEHLGENASLCNEKKTQGVWLRLHNNSKWAINIEANTVEEDSIESTYLTDKTSVSILKDNVAVTTCYEVEAIPTTTTKVRGDGGISLNVPVKVKVPQTKLYCSCSWRTGSTRSEGVWILPGRSVTFSVPREALNKNLKIYTLFSYEWEQESGSFRDNEPIHKVYFYSYDLPKNIDSK